MTGKNEQLEEEERKERVNQRRERGRASARRERGPPSVSDSPALAHQFLFSYAPLPSRAPLSRPKVSNRRHRGTKARRTRRVDGISKGKEADARAAFARAMRGLEGRVFFSSSPLSPFLPPLLTLEEENKKNQSQPEKNAPHKDTKSLAFGSTTSSAL